MIKTYENFTTKEISLIDDILSSINLEFVSHDQQMALKYAVRNKLRNAHFTSEETVIVKQIFDGDLDAIEPGKSSDSVFNKYYRFEEELDDLITSLKFKWKEDEEFDEEGNKIK